MATVTMSRMIYWSAVCDRIWKVGSAYFQYSYFSIRIWINRLNTKSCFKPLIFNFYFILTSLSIITHAKRMFIVVMCISFIKTRVEAMYGCFFLRLLPLEKTFELGMIYYQTLHWVWAPIFPSLFLSLSLFPVCL